MRKYEIRLIWEERRGRRAFSGRGGAHPDVRPLDRRPEPDLRRRGVRGGHRGRRHRRPADVRPGQRAVRPRLLPAPEDRPAVVRLRPGGDRAVAASRRAAAVPVVGVGGARWRAASTPSSTSSTTATSGPATCCRPRRVAGDKWEKEGRSGQARVLGDHHRVPRPERRARRHRPRRRRPHRAPGHAEGRAS